MKREIRTGKCVYCDNDKKAEHFVCVDCGSGMCDECYDRDEEHTEHSPDFHECVEDEEVYQRIVKKTGHPYGYLCYECMTDAEVEE